MCVAGLTLYLFVTNDGDIYRTMTSPLQRGLALKWRAGIYSHEGAVRGFLKIANDGARKYNKEFPESRAFSVNERMRTAESMANYFEAEYRLGNIGGGVSGVKKTTKQIEAEIRQAMVKR